MAPPESKSQPLWLPPISLAVCGLIVLMVSVFWQLIPIRITGQAFLLIVILHAFLYWPPMARLFTSMPVVHRLVFGVLLGAMILGHYTLNGRTYFPFVVWAIFPHVEEQRDTVTAREFIATTANDEKVRLLAEQLFPSLVQIDRIEDFSPEATEHLARVLAQAYNQHHVSDPVRSVDLMVMAVKLHPPAGETRAQPSCELLEHYDISSAR